MFVRSYAFPLIATALFALGGCNNLTDAGDVDTGEGDGDDVGTPGAPQIPPNKVINCSYPVGTTGVSQGNTLAITLGWDNALPAGEGAARRLDAAEFFDCDGSQGIDALVVDTSQYG